MTFENERRALDEQRRTLERERQEFTRRVEIEDRRLEQQQKLFDMKFTETRRAWNVAGSVKYDMKKSPPFPLD